MLAAAPIDKDGGFTLKALSSETLGISKVYTTRPQNWRFHLDVFEEFFSIVREVCKPADAENKSLLRALMSGIICVPEKS